MARKLPTHIPGTINEWRVNKRREMQAIIKAIDEFRIGSAYTPVRRDIHELERLVGAMKEKLRGRWNP